MTYDPFTKKTFALIACCFAALFTLTGCARHDYKAEADQRVYNIIDQKWKEDFGSKVNYKISDTEPEPQAIKIEKTIPGSGILSLPKAVAIATTHNRQYHLQKELLYTTALDLRLTRHDFESSFFGSGEGGYASSDGDNIVAAAASTGFSRLLATGARISTNIAVAWVRILTGDVQNSGLGTILTAEIVQPLLRGSNTEVVLENLTQAERDTLYQIRLFNRFRKIFVVEVISQYYLVLKQYDIVKNAEQNYRTLDKLYERVEKLAAFGRVPREELARVRQEKLQATDTLLQAKKLYKQTLDEFKFRQLSLPADIEFQLDVNELEILRSAELTGPEFSGTEAIDAALVERLDLANRSDAIADAERKVVVAADSLGADLSLTVTAEIPAQNLSTSEIKQIPDVLATSLVLDLPIDRVAEQNVYRKALITLNQSQRDYEEMADMVTLEVRQAYRDLKEAADRHSVQVESLELARKRFRDTSLLLQYGRVSSRRILNAQEDLFDARNAATETLIAHTIAMLNFYRDTGVLEVRPDGMWNQRFR